MQRAAVEVMNAVYEEDEGKVSWILDVDIRAFFLDVLEPLSNVLYSSSRRRTMGFERISIDSNICHGQACIKGTRIPVHQIVGMLANGDTIEDLLNEYPSLSREDIMACLAYAASLAEEQVTPIETANR